MSTDDLAEAVMERIAIMIEDAHMSPFAAAQQVAINYRLNVAQRDYEALSSGDVAMVAQLLRRQRRAA